MVSPTIVGETRPGDRWRLSNPHGGMQVDRDAGDVLMVAGSTGLAPLRALIMDLTRWGVNPRVHLFFGARYPCELYDLRDTVADRVEQPLALGVPGVGVPPTIRRGLPTTPMCSRPAAFTCARPASCRRW